MAPIAKALVLLAVFATAATCTGTETPDGDVIDGGFYSSTVTTEMTTLLATAMTADGDDGYSPAVGSTRVCFAKVRSLEVQDVDGTNYRFHVTGCAVSSVKKAGKCTQAVKKRCRARKFVVQVYEQWGGALEVSSISTE